MDLGGEKGSGGEDKGKNKPADSTEKGSLSDDSSPFVSVDTTSSEGDLAQSGGGALDCFTSSMESCLPAKRRGLSSQYKGHSKSFENLLDMGSENAEDLGKEEHPTNKKQRLIIANKNLLIKEKSLPSKISSTSAAAVEASSSPKGDDADEDVKVKAKDDDKNEQGDQ